MPQAPQFPSSRTLYPHAAESAESLYEKGRKLLLAREFDQAIVQFKRSLALNQRHLPTLICLASALFILGRHSLALNTYQMAHQLAPNSAEALNGMGTCFQVQGDFDKAIAYFEKALKIRPDDVQYIHNIVLIQKISPDSPLAKKLQRIYDAPNCKSNDRVYAGFSLGRIYEGQGDLHRAFQYYNEANREQAALMPYNEAAQLAIFDAVEHTFNSSLFARLKNTECTDRTPVFVLGMPRSGTSLVEQVLASHSAVYGAGEINVMPRIAERIIPELSGAPFPAAMNSMKPGAFRLIAEHALQHLRSHCSDNSLHIVDKNPNNYFLIGLIRLVFPAATIIHCARDPMDNCWSLFKQHFTGPNPYCYNQAALGRYYRRYQRMIRHWHQMFPGEIHEVQYEQMVKQPEPTIRALLEHCCLPWEEGCLSFYRTKRTVATMSARQVRRPLYTDSIAAWEALAKELAPLRAALQE